MSPIRIEISRWLAQAKALVAGATLLAITACGGGGGGGNNSNPSPQTYTVGGTLSGLTAAGLTLTFGTQTVTPAANASTFTFATGQASGTAYAVTVSAQPSGLTCTVGDGSGTIGTSNVTGITVTCNANNLSGTAATGAAITHATLTLVDSAGKQVTATTDASGNYSLSTAGLTAPFLVKVVTASASPNGYASGSTFYSVSDQSTPSVINVTPLTDLIVRNWYAVQASPVSVDTAFADPASNPPPSVATVQLIQAMVLDIVQPLLQQKGVDPIGLDLISGAFSANGQGIDGALDAIQPVSYNSNDTTATLTVATNGTTTQTSTLTAGAGSTQVSTSTKTSAGAASAVVLTSIIPTSTGESTALAGVQATLTNIQNLIQSKGTGLQPSDAAAFVDPNFLNGGETAAQQEQGIAAMGGATINAFTVTRIASFDPTNNLIGIMGTINYTRNGVTGSLQLGYGADSGMILKLESGGSWLLYGDQQEVKTQASLQSINQTGIGGYTFTGEQLIIQASVPASSNATPCSSSYATSISVFPATAISGTNQNTAAPVTIGTGGYSLLADPSVSQDDGASSCEFDELLNAGFVVPASALPGLVGDVLGFAVNGGSQIPALARTLQGYTTETINFTNVTSNALSAAALGQPLTLQWNLPVTFPVYDIEVYGLVVVASGSAFVNCSVEPSVPLSVGSTSVSLTLPTTCNGSSVVSIPQNGSAPAAAQINVLIRGSHGEVAAAWWGFN